MGLSCSETGLVTRLLPDGRAEIRIRRAEACHSCQSKSACLALGGQMQDLMLQVDNAIGAREGDEVSVALDSASVLQASVVLYLIPTVLLLGGALAGQALAPSMDSNADTAALVGSAVGLLIGLMGIRMLNRRLGKRPAFVPRLVSVLRSADSHQRR